MITLVEQGYQHVPFPTPGNLTFSTESLGIPAWHQFAQDLAKKFGILRDSDRIRALGASHERGRITGPGQS